MTDLGQTLTRLAGLVETDPARAADELDALAGRLTALATRLRAQAPRSPAGMSDRVQIAVVGPDGKVKQTVDTGAAQP